MNAPPRPPSPPRTALRNTIDWARSPLEQPVEWASQWGDVVRVPVLGLNYIVVSDPELIEQVLVRNWKDFRKDSFTRGLKRALGEGLVTAEGDVWKRHRSLVQPAFHKERLASYHRDMARIAEEHVATWQDGQALDLHAAFTHMTFEIVAATLFGSEVTPEMHVVGDALEILMDDFASLELNVWPEMPEWIPTPRSLRRRGVIPKLDAVVSTFIERRRAKPGPDLLSALIEARDEAGGAFDEEALRDEAVTLMLAGHETTSVALTMCFELLSRHPEVFHKLRTELDEVLGDAPLTPEALPRLRYTEAVIRESMRVYPPVYAVAREAIRDTTVGDFAVHKGEQVAMFMWVVHHDPRWWPEPEQFRPERWLDAKPVHRFAWFPFGGGPRACVGLRFAMAEAILLTAAVARHFQPERKAPPPVMVPSVTLRPKGGLPTTLRRV